MRRQHRRRSDAALRCLYRRDGIFPISLYADHGLHGRYAGCGRVAGRDIACQGGRGSAPRFCDDRDPRNHNSAHVLLAPHRSARSQKVRADSLAPREHSEDHLRGRVPELQVPSPTFGGALHPVAVPHGAQGVHRASARRGSDVSRGYRADRAIALHIRDPAERPWLSCHEVHHQPHQPRRWQRQAA